MKRIDLSKTYSLDNQERNHLEMREPTVRDNLMVRNVRNEDEREIQLLANLCNISTNAIEELTLADYSRVTKAFLDFLGTPQPTSDGQPLH